MSSFEEIFGADQAAREIRARDYAVMQEIAIRTNNLADLARIQDDYVGAGLTRLVRAARKELIEVYDLNDPDREPDALTTLREMIDPGVEDYRRSGGVQL